MAIHSSMLPWRIPCREEPGGPQSMGSRRVGHDRSGLAHMCKGEDVWAEVWVWGLWSCLEDWRVGLLEPLRVRPLQSSSRHLPSTFPWLSPLSILPFLSSSLFFSLPSFLSLLLSPHPLSPDRQHPPPSFLPLFSGLPTGTPYSLLSIYSIPTLTPPRYAIFFHLKTAVTSDPRVCLWENHLTPVA